MVGLSVGTIWACNENYNKPNSFNPNYKWDKYNKWEYKNHHSYFWKHHYKFNKTNESKEPPEPEIPDYCNLRTLGPGNVFGNVLYKNETELIIGQFSINNSV